MLIKFHVCITNQNLTIKFNKNDSSIALVTNHFVNQIYVYNVNIASDISKQYSIPCSNASLSCSDIRIFKLQCLADL
ncbi:hypothetical protein VNO77_22140 [Canavalia gladiata]|uniref:Uncharacterized protein n=1 Tax=Canavalia gladiata TaxID=3824 RepID=A0AAN9L221_CANGL